MSEIVNLRRVRKEKARGEKDKAAKANRVKHGTAKSIRALARARAAKSAHSIEQHKMEDSE
jgi:hypothetical protein